jgi:hypothetical protein
MRESAWTKAAEQPKITAIAVTFENESHVIRSVSLMMLGSSSLPGRLCPAITARGLSDSILSSAEIHSLCFCVVGQPASLGWVPLKT